MTKSTGQPPRRRRKRSGASDLSVRMLLLRGGGPGDVLDAAGWRRVRARCAWVKERTAAWRDAQRAMDARCHEAIER